MDFCGVKVKGRFFLAPMAGFTNLPFRLLCKNHGAALVFTEQIAARQIVAKKGIVEAMKTCKKERPVAVQLFGSEAKHFSEALNYCDAFDIININCGCPSQDITSSGAGAALLKKPEKIGEIIEILKKETEKPITVKMRLGWSNNNSLKVAKICEKAGADAIIVHGRLAEQGYSGKADWEAIRKVVAAVSITVVANGDINSGKSAKECLEKTKAEFAMIGRAAMANPLIFRENRDYFKGKEWKASDENKISLFCEYKKICEKHKMLELNDLKQKAMFFTKGINGSRKAREAISKAKSLDEIESALGQLYT